METYLAIITTALVLTQIIRLTQNAMQLSKYSKTDSKNDELLEIFRNINENLDEIVPMLDNIRDNTR